MDTKRKPRMDANDHAGFGAKLEWERLVRTERCNPEDPWHA
jgi:hypothetical protein